MSKSGKVAIASRVVRFFTKDKVEHVLHDMTVSCQCPACGKSFADSTDKGGAIFDGAIVCGSCAWRICTATLGTKKPDSICPHDVEFRKFFRANSGSVLEAIRSIVSKHGPMIPLHDAEPQTTES